MRFGYRWLVVLLAGLCWVSGATANSSTPDEESAVAEDRILEVQQVQVQAEDAKAIEVEASVVDTVATKPTVARSLTRDEQLHLLEAQLAQLELKRAQAAMNKAQKELEEVKSLFEEKLETIDKLNQAEQDYQEAVLRYDKAQIELQKKRLEFLKGATLITVVKAEKYRHADSEDMKVSITLRNDSDIEKARVVMAEMEGSSVEDLASLLKVDNLVVTLLAEVSIPVGTGQDKRLQSAGKPIVSDPYYQIVEELECGQEASLEFRLVRKDVENVTVRLEFLGTKKEYDIFLLKRGGQDLPDISSTQFSLIGQLGRKVRYDVELERLAKSERSFSLVVLNLPEQIPFAFRDPETDAMLTQVKFTEERSKQSLYFEVSLPEKLDSKLVDTNIPFYIVITHRQELKNIQELWQKYGRNIPPEEVLKIKGDRNKLELILRPKGVGKLEVLVANLFKEIEQGKPTELKFTVLNSGTLAVTGVTPELDPSLEWESELEPLEPATIGPGEKAAYLARITPPEDVAVGEYVVKVRTEGHAGVETIPALDKDFTIRVAAKSNITGTAILVGVLVVLVVGIAVASIKISRR